MGDDPDTSALLMLRRRTGYEAESAGEDHGTPMGAKTMSTPSTVPVASPSLGLGLGSPSTSDSALASGMGLGPSSGPSLEGLILGDDAWDAHEWRGLEEGGVGHTSGWGLSARQDMGPYAGFWVIGVINNFGYVVMLTAAETILTGRSGYVLAADVGPSLVMKVFASTAGRGMHPLLRTAVVCGLGCGSFMLVSRAASPTAALVGVGVGSAAAGLGEAGFLSYTSRFSKYTPLVVGGWSSGTGFSGVVGAASWVVLHEWLGLDSSRILSILAWVPIIILVAHVRVLAPKEHSTSETERVVQRDLDGRAAGALRAGLGSARGGVGEENGYAAAGSRARRTEHRRGLSTASLHGWVEDGLQEEGDEDDRDGDDASDNAELEGLLKFHGKSAARLDGITSAPTESVADMAGAMASRVHETIEGAVPDGFWVSLRQVGSALPPVMVPLLFVYFFEYLINQALFLPLGLVVAMDTEANDTRIPESTQTSVSHACSAYAKFQMSYQVGVMISRTSLEFFKWERPLWHLSVMQGINLLVALVAVILSGGKGDVVGFNLPLFLVCLFAVWEGLIGGATYVNGFHRLALATREGRLREFAMGVASIADGVGILCAGLTAAALEPTLLAHVRSSGNAVCE